MTGWDQLRPADFDRTKLGKRPPVPGLFGRSAALQMPGQGDLLDDTETAGDDLPADDMPCQELF